ncbi:MAG: hypothetical protein ACR2MD_13125 [Aridibacter sp.]
MLEVKTSEKESKFNKFIKSDKNVCPKQFCFNWREEGQYHPTSGCNWSLRKYNRDEETQGEVDYYEPHEPNLRKAKLPLFYFVNSPKTLTKEFIEEYIRESERLWVKSIGLNNKIMYLFRLPCETFHAIMS